jgi:hypothetical protein
MFDKLLRYLWSALLTRELTRCSGISEILRNVREKLRHLTLAGFSEKVWLAIAAADFLCHGMGVD